jgi:hypothetical protein
MAVIETITGAGIAVVVSIITSEYNRHRQKMAQKEKSRQEVMDTIQKQTNVIINTYSAYLDEYEETSVPYQKASRARAYFGTNDLIELKYRSYFDDELAEKCRDLAGHCLELNHWTLPPAEEYDREMDLQSKKFMERANSLLGIAEDIDNRIG